MVKPIIEVTKLSKLYRLGTFGAQSMLDDVSRLVNRFRGKEAKIPPEEKRNSMWALKDVTFDVSPGEIVGIIGGNGAGKSTLLKILSRITEPTEGEAVLRGKVSSLIEVGTGFHPYLSGKENVFLNAAILGMPRSVTRAKLADILAFAEIGEFADTPVKRYSSGMRVRLAFAVAAYLEPDILIVDEVLAVGDEQFQKKCLGKMSDVAKHGRTILFVSHDLAAVQHLCDRVIVLRKGQIIADGKPGEAIQNYLDTLREESLDPSDQGPDEGKALIGSVLISQGPGTVENLLMVGKPAHIKFDVSELGSGGHVVLEFHHDSGALVSRFSSRSTPLARNGGVAVSCIIDELLLSPGRYRLAAGLFSHDVLLNYQEHVTSFEVRPGYLNGVRVSSQRESGYVHFPHRWRLEPGEVIERAGHLESMSEKAI